MNEQGKCRHGRPVKSWLGWIWLAFAMPLVAGSLSWDIQRTMAPVSDESDYFLQAPVSVAFDGDDRFFLLDISSRVIFWWDAQGKFGGTIGNPGQGPGEFSFRTRSGPQGYLAILGEELHVFDAGQRSVHVFDLSGNHRRSARLGQVNGRTEAFYAVADQGYVVLQHNFMNAEPTFEVNLHNKDGSLAKTIYSVPEKEIGRPVMPPSGGKIFIEAYFPIIVTAYDANRDAFILGNSGKPSFRILSLTRDRARTVTFQRVPLEVEERDKREYRSLNWIRNSPRFEAVFPKDMPYYDIIQPLASGHFLLYNQSPVEGRVRGLWIDGQGRTLGRMAMALGQNGGLFTTRGRLIRVLIDDQGVFQVAEVRPSAGQ